MDYECCRVLSGSLGVYAAKGVYRASCITNALDCIRTEMRVPVLSETQSLRLAPLGAQEQVYSAVPTPASRRKEDWAKGEVGP